MKRRRKWGEQAAKEIYSHVQQTNVAWSGAKESRLSAEAQNFSLLLVNGNVGE